MRTAWFIVAIFGAACAVEEPEDDASTTGSPSGAGAATSGPATTTGSGEMATSGAGQGAAPASCLDDPNAALSSAFICVSGIT